MIRRILWLTLITGAIVISSANAVLADTDADFVERHISQEDRESFAPNPEKFRPAATPPTASTSAETVENSENLTALGHSSATTFPYSPNFNVRRNYDWSPVLPDDKSEKFLLPPMQIPSVTFPADIRQPIGVNLLYNADANLLRRQLSALDQPTALEFVPGVAKVFITPWGAVDGALPVAAKVYQYLKRRGGVKTLIMVARPHGENLAGPASVWVQGGYATPLGVAKINALAARRLAAHPDFNYEPAAHLTDPALETNVLLAQYFLPDAQIVPVLINPRTRADFEQICQQLAKVVVPDGVVMIAITNLSYGFPERDVAGRYDLQTLSELQTLDLNVINNLGKKRDAQIMSGAGILDSPRVAMAAVLVGLFLEMDTLTWFDYDAPRQFPGAPLISGCAAGALSARARRERVEQEIDGAPVISIDAGKLSAVAAQELLRIARDSLQAAAALARYDAPYPQYPELLKQRAVFVSVIDGENKELASMGTLNNSLLLPVAVTEAARMCAAGEDPQMAKRLNAQDAKTGIIEVAVLKNLRAVGSWQEVKNGQGVAIARGDLRSIVLPATAERRQWSVEDMLAFACRRAGLRPDAYRSDRVDILAFETDVYRQEGARK